jgi:hypothetical protein
LAESGHEADAASSRHFEPGSVDFHVLLYPFYDEAALKVA